MAQTIKVVVEANVLSPSEYRAVKHSPSCKCIQHYNYDWEYVVEYSQAIKYQKAFALKTLRIL